MYHNAKMVIMKRMMIVLAAFAALGIWGCTPEPGPGGLAQITGVTAHHAQVIPGTRVFIKYDASTSPGTSPSAYDDSTQSGSNGRFSFVDLEKGVYYIYGIGFDSTVGMPVSAGIPVVISEKKEVEEVLLPVTE
jgi:hypothetical protein